MGACDETQSCFVGWFWWALGKGRSPCQGVMAERVAAGLGLLLELEEERKLARERQADLALIQKMEGLLAAEECAGSILSEDRGELHRGRPGRAGPARFSR